MQKKDANLLFSFNAVAAATVSDLGAPPKGMSPEELSNITNQSPGKAYNYVQGKTGIGLGGSQN